MIEIVPDALRLFKQNLSISSRALNLDEYFSIQPLNFQFYYAKNGKAEIVNTLYLEDGNPKLDLCLELFNESTESVTFKQAQGANPAAGLIQCHFYIRFEKDLQLKPKDIAVEPLNQWQVNYDEDDYFFTLYFLHKNGLVLKKQDSPNKSDRILLTLKNLSANNRAVKSSNVELIYGSPLVLNGEIPGATLFTEVLSCKNTISVTHHPDQKNIPLQFRFIGPNTILNDGTTVNNLKLKIFNRPLSNNSRPNLLLDKPNSRFIVSFEANNSEEALTTLPRANNTKITATEPNKWKVEKTQNAPEWKIEINSSSNIDKLTAGEGIELNISDLVTSNGSGVAYLYITYQNIGDYPDGQLVIPIEKTPLLYREHRVGIGTTTPSAKLHIVGSDGENTHLLRINNSNNEVLIRTWPNGGTLEFGGWNNGWNIGTTTQDKHLYINRGASGKSNVYIGQVDKEVCVENTGKVGIGTHSPSAKLHVSGGDAIISDGKVGIGTHSPSAKLHVSGGDAIISDNVSIGTADTNTLTVRGSITSTHSTRRLVVNNPIVATSFIGEGAMVTGMIVMWSGSVNNIPSGWALCNGNGGTPDLRDRFIVGAGNSYNVGNTGGSAQVALSLAQMPRHNHSNGSYKQLLQKHEGGWNSTKGVDTTPGEPDILTSAEILPAGEGAAHENRPPYYALAYIMKK